jgi:hypothetical protein
MDAPKDRALTDTDSTKQSNVPVTMQPSPFNSPSKSKRQGRKSPKKNQKSPTKAATEPKSNQATPTKNGNKRGVKQDTPEHTNEADRHAKKLAEKKAGNTAMDTNVSWILLDHHKWKGYQTSHLQVQLLQGTLDGNSRLRAKRHPLTSPTTK